MKFYPKRKFIAFLGIFSIIVSAGMTFLSFPSFDLKITIPALIFFGIFVFLIFPVIKNQVVDVKNNGIIIYNFGKGFELSSDDLFEVVRRKKGGGLCHIAFKKVFIFKFHLVVIIMISFFRKNLATFLVDLINKIAE